MRSQIDFMRRYTIVISMPSNRHRRACFQPTGSGILDGAMRPALPTLLMLLGCFLGFSSGNLRAVSSAKPELLTLRKEYDRRAKEELDSVARWYEGQLEELKRSPAAKSDPDAVLNVQHEVGAPWYRDLLGRPPEANPDPKKSAWLPLQKLQEAAQARRAKAIDPLTRKYRAEVDAIRRRAERDSDAEGLLLATKAWRAAFPIEPTAEETSTWLVGTKWRWWGAETVEMETAGRARYVLGATIKDMRWKLRDPGSVLIRFGTEEPGPGSDFLELFWTHCIMHAANGRTWRIDRLDR
jgi:hypothetical protein